MMFGMRVRGGLLAALIMFAVPVATALVATFASAPAAAETVASIEVEGNRRVEAETIRSYFKVGPNGQLDAGAVDDVAGASWALKIAAAPKQSTGTNA